MDTEPFWTASESLPRYPRLEKGISADVVVVGAGITGLTAAYHLASAGKKTAVIDKSGIVSGDSACTSGHLTAALDGGFSKLARLHGAKTARAAAESHRWAIDWIESFILSRRVECGFKRVDGYLCGASRASRKEMDREWRALSAAGFSDAQRAENPPERGLQGPAIRFPRQARFHTVRYLKALARAVEEEGGRIFGRTAFKRLHSGRVETDAPASIETDRVVIATHSPVQGTLVFLKQYAFRTYVIGLRVPKNKVTDALYWDTEEPYHYVRVQPLDSAHDLLIVGGEDHKTGRLGRTDPRAPFRRLQEWTARRFGGSFQTRFAWSGQVLEPVDGLAYIGRIPYRHGRMYMATGYSGNGLTYGTLAGKMIADQILDIRNAWTKIYDPTRKNIASAGHFVQEGLSTARQMTHLAPDGPRLRSASHLKPGEGGVLPRGLKPAAVYRDEGGTLHSCSAICTHMGCVVQWNPAEKSFDCPCHGSRFSALGKVLNGPAIHDLEKKKEPSLAKK